MRGDPEQGPTCFLPRLDIHQRIQHIMLIVSFTTLVITGLPLRFAGSPSARFITQVVGGAYVASIVHRSAAVLLILATIYHFVYLGIKVARGQRKTDMLPQVKDVADFIGSVKYDLGLVSHRPRYGRYTFGEKFEYWALLWGTAVMIVTGLILWNPVRSSQHLPIIFLTVARVIHSYEALLAFLAIIIWHLYNAHLRPDVFPMSKTWLSGCMTEEEMRENHPIYYEELMAQRGGSNEEDNPR